MARRLLSRRNVVLAVLLSAVTLEAGSYVLCRVMLHPRAPNLLYSPPAFQDETWGQYPEIWHPVTGWPTSKELTNRETYDESGARPSPAFPEPGGECLSLYGDSFTQGWEATDEEVWGNLLAESLGCRVANFGVGAYGVDQAALRFEGNDVDTAPVTLLGILPHDILRNLNQFQYYISGYDAPTFKPRFVLEGGALTLIPPPRPTEEELQTLLADPASILPYETFLPGNGVGPEPMGFPHAAVLARLALTHEVIPDWRRGVPTWKRFLDPDHPSQALAITTGIVTRMRDACVARGKRFGVILFPTPTAYQEYATTGVPTIQPLVDELERAGIPVLPLTPAFHELLEGRPLCEVLTMPEHCAGHLSPDGNRMVAELVEAFLLEEGLLPAGG